MLLLLPLLLSAALTALLGAQLQWQQQWQRRLLLLQGRVHGMQPVAAAGALQCGPQSRKRRAAHPMHMAMNTAMNPVALPTAMNMNSSSCSYSQCR
mgnify:CR=1 FL=1